MKNSLFIEPKTLKSKSVKSNVKILDATFFLPDSGLNAEEEYQKEHISNSVFFVILIAGMVNQFLAMVYGIFKITDVSLLIKTVREYLNLFIKTFLL